MNWLYVLPWTPGQGGGNISATGTVLPSQLSKNWYWED